MSNTVYFGTAGSVDLDNFYIPKNSQLMSFSSFIKDMIVSFGDLDTKIFGSFKDELEACGYTSSILASFSGELTCHKLRLDFILDRSLKLIDELLTCEEGTEGIDNLNKKLEALIEKHKDILTNFEYGWATDYHVNAVALDGEPAAEKNCVQLTFPSNSSNTTKGTFIILGDNIMDKEASASINRKLVFKKLQLIQGDTERNFFYKTHFSSAYSMLPLLFHSNISLPKTYRVIRNDNNMMYVLSSDVKEDYDIKQYMNPSSRVQSCVHCALSNSYVGLSDEFTTHDDMQKQFIKWWPTRDRNSFHFVYPTESSQCFTRGKEERITDSNNGKMSDFDIVDTGMWMLNTGAVDVTSINNFVDCDGKIIMIDLGASFSILPSQNLKNLIGDGGESLNNIIADKSILRLFYHRFPGYLTSVFRGFTELTVGVVNRLNYIDMLNKYDGNWYVNRVASAVITETMHGLMMVATSYLRINRNLCEIASHYSQDSFERKFIDNILSSNHIIFKMLFPIMLELVEFAKNSVNSEDPHLNNSNHKEKYIAAMTLINIMEYRLRMRCNIMFLEYLSSVSFHSDEEKAILENIRKCYPDTLYDENVVQFHCNVQNAPKEILEESVCLLKDGSLFHATSIQDAEAINLIDTTAINMLKTSSQSVRETFELLSFPLSNVCADYVFPEIEEKQEVCSCVS